LSRRASSYDELIYFDPRSDWTLLTAKSARECRELLNYLWHEQQYINQAGALDKWALRMKGWEAVEPLVGSVNGLGFVAMSFDKDLDEVYETGIRAAIEADCGFQAHRMDRVHHDEQITVKMLVDIRRAEFMAADFTGHKSGVYFEAGFAAALDKKVIWTCRDGEDSTHQMDNAGGFENRACGPDTPPDPGRKAGLKARSMSRPCHGAQVNNEAGFRQPNR
jgi:hypothetical protein